MTLNGNKTPERRRFTRIAQEDVFVCETFDMRGLGIGAKKFGHMITKNLSQEGLLFESVEALALGTILKLQVDLPGLEKYKHNFYKADQASGRQPLIVLGKVVRVEDTSSGNFDIGIAFIAVDNTHKFLLKQYFKDFKK